MKTSNFCAVPCWSTTHAPNTTSEGEVNPTMALWGEEIDLDEGLKRMQREGWQLITIQAHQTTNGILLQHAPNCYYLFKKNNEQE